MNNDYLRTTNEKEILGFLIGSYKSHWELAFISDTFDIVKNADNLKTLRDYFELFDSMKVAEIHNATPSRAPNLSSKNEKKSKSKKRDRDTEDLVDVSTFTPPTPKKRKKSNSRKRSLMLARSDTSERETLIKTLVENSHTLYADRSFRSFDTVLLKGQPSAVQLWRLEKAFKLNFERV